MGDTAAVDLEAIYEEHWRLYPWEREFGRAVMAAEQGLSNRGKCLLVLAGCERWAWVLEFGGRTVDHRDVASALDHLYGLHSSGRGFDDSERQAWLEIVDSVTADEDDYLPYRLWWMLDGVRRGLDGGEVGSVWGLSQELADMTSPSPLPPPSFEPPVPTRDDLLAWVVEMKRRQWDSGTMPIERSAFLESVEAARSPMASHQLDALRKQQRHWGKLLWNAGQILPWKPDPTPGGHRRSEDPG
jgi:hypothetical protein